MHGSSGAYEPPPRTNLYNQLSNSDDRGWPVKKMQQVGSTRIRRERRPGDPFQMSKFTSSHHISDGPGVRTPKVLRRTDDRLRTASTQVWHHHPLICLITYSLNQLLYMNLTTDKLKVQRYLDMCFLAKIRSMAGSEPPLWEADPLQLEARRGARL